jgi:hypothetical protein
MSGIPGEELIRGGYVFKRQGKDFRNETDFFVSDSKTTRGLSENQQLQSKDIQRNKKKKQRKEGEEKAPPPLSPNDILKKRIDSLREYWISLGLPATPKTTNRYAIGDLKDSLDFYSDEKIKESMKNYAELLEAEHFSESDLPGGKQCGTYKHFIQRWINHFTRDGIKHNNYDLFLPEEGTV